MGDAYPLGNTTTSFLSNPTSSSNNDFNESALLLEWLTSMFGTPISILCLLAGIPIIFYILAEVCDEALVPALEELSSALVIPHDVACATFLAFGSSVPELCITTLAVMRSGSSGSSARLDIAFGTITGSGLIAFSVLPALCVRASPDLKLQLSVVPLIRDVIFYLFGVALLVWFTRDGQVTLKESSILLGCYVVYLVVMLLLVPLYHREEQNEQQKADDVLEIHEEYGHIRRRASERSLTSLPRSFPDYGSTAIASSTPKFERRDSSMSDSNASEEEPPTRFASCKHKFFRFVPPFNLEEDDVKKNWKWLVVVSILYVILLSELALIFTTALAEAAGLSHHVVGVVLCALGAQIDDAFASIAVAKQGKGPSAIANALGSQVLNVLFAIGLPFTLYGLMFNKPVYISSHRSEDNSGAVLLGCVLLFSLLALRSKLFAGEFCLKTPDAIVLLVAYVGFVLWISWNTE